MNTCREVATQIADQLNGLGEQIAFKRADLPALLAKQQECKEAIQASTQINKIEARRGEAVDLLKRRSFGKAQMALSECLKMLADIELEESELAAVQTDIAETKKVHIFLLTGSCLRILCRTNAASTSF